MNFEIVEVGELSGRKGIIYSIILEGKKQTLFDEFLYENDEQYSNEIDDIYERLFAMGHEVGFREGFFKDKEGLPGDGVCALFDLPDKHLRLYCIRFGAIAIILGGGGVKNVRAWQENSVLSERVTLMIAISNKISERIREGDLKLTECGFKGDVKWIEDYEDR